MKLSEVITEYIALKQSMGARFHTEAVILKAFSKALGNVAIAEVAVAPVHAYISGAGPVTGSGTVSTRRFAASTVLRSGAAMRPVHHYRSSCPSLPSLLSLTSSLSRSCSGCSMPLLVRRTHAGNSKLTPYGL